MEETWHGKVDTLSYLQQPRLKYVYCAGTVCVCVCVFFSHESIHCYLTTKFTKHMTAEAQNTENIFREVYQSRCLLHPIMIIKRLK